VLPYVCPPSRYLSPYRPKDCLMPKSEWSLHSHNYTTVLSSIPWDQYQLHCINLQTPPHAMHHHHQPHLTNNPIPQNAPYSTRMLHQPLPTWTQLHTYQPHYDISSMEEDEEYLFLLPTLHCYCPTKANDIWQEPTPTTLALSFSNSVGLSSFANGTWDNTIIRVTFFK